METSRAGEWIPVPEYVRALLLRLADGWRPSSMVMGVVDQLRYDMVDLAESSPALMLNPDHLKVNLGSQTSELWPFSFGGTLHGVLQDGTSIQGQDPTRVTRGADTAIEFSSWLISEGTAPSLWTGEILGARRVPFGGNMVVEPYRDDGILFGHRAHFRMCGSYRYYVVQTGDAVGFSWKLLIDTLEGQPDTAKLTDDFLLLQFVFGQELQIQQIHGVTSDGRTVATMNGVGTRPQRRASSVAPVPMGRNNHDWIEESWAPLLFERVSAAWSARPELRNAYRMAFDSYLGAMTSFLDADYLRLQVSLEAFSYWILKFGKHKEQEEETNVENTQRWKSWVKANASSIRALAKPGREESLYNKVMTAYRRPSSRLVQSAFQRHGLELTTEMISEVDARNVIVHQGLMASDGYDGVRDVRRIALVRTMLIALISKSAQYAGAIEGWEVGAAGYQIEPTGWWIVQDDDRLLANRTYIAEGRV